MVKPVKLVSRRSMLYVHLAAIFFPGHWLLMDAMGIGLCVAFIAFVRLPSLKVSTLLLSGLLLYDVFWVFFSQYVFSANVMVKVATRPAANPMGAMARRFHIGMTPRARFFSFYTSREIVARNNDGYMAQVCQDAKPH